MLGRVDPLAASRRWRRSQSRIQEKLGRSKESAFVRTRQLNRLSSVGLVVLSFTALIVVLWGYTQPPLPDEGTGAHIFQLSIVALLPVTLVFVATADWSRPSRSAWPLAVAIVATGLAFVALYYLEHVYYPGQLG
jgi:uncharacterized BrkB/YihY/UPF0761 family membrane protein